MSKDITAKLRRLETIFRWLANTKRESFTADELARKYRVSRRTILRDIALLKEVGIELIQYRGKYDAPADFSLEQLGLTPQIAATLCIAYEAAKETGEEFAPACQYIHHLFSPNKKLYEINPTLPKDSIICKLQKAIQEKRYIRISSSGRQIYAKPCCLIRRWEAVYLVFTAMPSGKSVGGYALARMEVADIESVSFEKKGRRIKTGHFASLGVPKYRIDKFIREHF